ncbi:MAG: PD-(D/E)XK nuclease family protein [Actinobacteria bacterium]|jgi:RecB family exonuclease|nr:MAG: PD-(D/E)XK nuclease family protein [Actinomycetota bacterium]
MLLYLSPQTVVFPAPVVESKEPVVQVRLSYSAVSSYEKCPLSYRFQYVDGLEVEPTSYLSFGRSMHAALEWLYDRDTPEPPSLEGLLAYLDKCWESEGYASLEDERSFLKNAREVLTQYYYSNLDAFRLPVAVEERFEIDMDDYILSGVIDRVDCNVDGTYEILDYKTSRRLPELSRLREDLQLPIYQLACREVWGITPSKLTFYYLIPNRRYTTRPCDADGLSRVEERLAHTAQCISKGDFPATPNRLCPWCSFEDICPERTATGHLGESYLARHRALLRRRVKLEEAIALLEEEMDREGITIAGEDERHPSPGA